MWLLTILLPTIVLVASGSSSGSSRTRRSAGCRWIDIFAPSMVVMTLAILGVNTLPARLVKYREKGVLRRLSTTPASPRSLLIAQLVVNMGVAVVSLVVLIVVGNLVFQIPLPKDPIGFAVAFLLGMSALFALGLLVAAVAPTAGIATALFVPLFALVMFLGGVYLPRMMLPEFLIRIGDYTPPGVQALLDSLDGDLAAARPACGHGPDHGRGRRRGRQAVPLGMSGSPARPVSAEPPAPSVYERWSDRLTDWCPWVTLAVPSVLALALVGRQRRRAPRHGGAGRPRRGLGVPGLHAGPASAASPSGPDARVLHRPAGDRDAAGDARVPSSSSS